jgi:hypothetical protein
MLKKLLAGASALLLSATASYALFYSNVDRIIASSNSVPVLSACGGAVAGDAGSSDTAGTVTQGGTVTTCTLTFGTAFVAAPSCMVQDLTTPRAAFAVAITNTALTVTGLTASDKLAWMCMAKSGG